jgi:hypothetical protein
MLKYYRPVVPYKGVVMIDEQKYDKHACARFVFLLSWSIVLFASATALLVIVISYWKQFSYQWIFLVLIVLMYMVTAVFFLVALDSKQAWNNSRNVSTAKH